MRIDLEFSWFIGLGVRFGSTPVSIDWYATKYISFMLPFVALKISINV